MLACQPQSLPQIKSNLVRYEYSVRCFWMNLGNDAGARWFFFGVGETGGVQDLLSRIADVG